MKHTIAHDLGRDQAKKVADAAWETYSARFADYSPTRQWVDERTAQIGFKAKGLSVKGNIEVNDRDIAVDLDVPFLLRPFKNTAIKVIEEEIRRWIQKSKAGEL